MAEGIRKRGKSWSYYFDGAMMDGKRNKIEKGGFRTSKEAREARTAAMNEYNNTGRTFSPKEISVADYLDYWLENTIRKNIDHGYTYQTYKSYANKIKNKIKPAFGIYRLSTFQYAPDKIQMWIDDMKTQKCSRESIRGYLGCLSSAMNYAILPLKYIQTNPCTPVRVGKMPVDINAKALNEYVCTKDDFSKILTKYPQGNKYHLSFTFPYYTGARIAETFAIDLMHDVDFEKHEICINKQIVKIGDNWCYRPPKYDSYRILRIGMTLENELKEAIKQRKKQCLRYGQSFYRTYVAQDNTIIQLKGDEHIGTAYKEIMPLCVSEKGKIITPYSYPNCCVKPIREQLGLTLFHAHCLRHTHGTMLAENGINPKTVMERLGHKDISTTLQTYTFNTEVMQTTAVDIFEKAAGN